MARNIVIFSDGTGQEGGVGSNTNIYKIFNQIEARSDNQIAFYDQGLGTDGKLITGNAFGRGFSQNMLDCYRFLFENYKSGDRIFLFGFSRGAATVRSLTGFLHLFGILPKSRADLIEEAFEIYKMRNLKKRDIAAKKLIKAHHTMWTKVRFLGVFDTVAALGFPYKSISSIIDRFYQHKFHNFDLSPCVEYARQALAIDDERKTFHPLPWTKYDGETPDKIKQVWFCGAHTDCGGGYPEHGVSDIAMGWMIQQAMEYGLRLYPDRETHFTIKEDINDDLHDERASFFGKIYRRAVRDWNEEVNGPLVIHESVTERKLDRNNENNPYDPWILKRDYEVEPWIHGIPR